MKEILANRANDNIFSLNDNNVYMSRGKVVNGESVGVGRASSSVVDGSSYSGVKSKSCDAGNPSVSKGKITRNDWRSLEIGEQRKVRDDFFKIKVKDKEWRQPRHKIGGRDAWEDNVRKNIYYTKDGRHNDIEVWQVSGKKAEHLGSMEPIEGTMYKKPNHPPAKFE